MHNQGLLFAILAVFWCKTNDKKELKGNMVHKQYTEDATQGLRV